MYMYVHQDITLNVASWACRNKDGKYQSGVSWPVVTVLLGQVFSPKRQILNDSYGFEPGRQNLDDSWVLCPRVHVEDDSNGVEPRTPAPGRFHQFSDSGTESVPLHARDAKNKKTQKH